MSLSNTFRPLHRWGEDTRTGDYRHLEVHGWIVLDDFSTTTTSSLVAIHPRGSGLSGPAAGDAYLLPDYVSDVEALCVHLKLEKPILLGWSHGGMVAQQFAFTYSDSLSRLILFDTSAYFGEFLSDIEAAVQDFKDEPWFEKSFTALKAEWAGEYETDDDMRAFGRMK